MGLQFISWMENLEEDEIPERTIWFNDDAIREHFEAVKKRREEKYGNDKDGPGPIDDPVQNQASKDLLVG